MSYSTGTIIVATDPNGLIGDRPDPDLPGRTPWQGDLTADMQYFQRETVHKPVGFTIATYLTIPEKYRPLRGREVFLWTRQTQPDVDGLPVVYPLSEVFQLYPDREVMLAGGGHLYRAALELPEVKTLLRTVVKGQFSGNVYFPEIGPEWELVRSIENSADDKNKFDYVWETYIKPGPAESRIVDPRNARSPEYRDELIRIWRSGQCPYCRGGKTQLEDRDRLVGENQYWLAIQTHTPIANTDHHIVIFPRKRHLTVFEQLDAYELQYLTRLIGEIRQKFGIKGNTYGLREGDTTVSGATVSHFHFNLYVPTPGKVVAVHFGQFNKPAA